MEKYIEWLIVVLLVVWIIGGLVNLRVTLDSWARLIATFLYPALAGATISIWFRYVAKNGIHSIHQDPENWMAMFVIVLFVVFRLLLEHDYPTRVINNRVVRDPFPADKWFTLVVHTLEAVGLLLAMAFLGLIEPSIVKNVTFFYIDLAVLDLLWQINRLDDLVNRPPGWWSIVLIRLSLLGVLIYGIIVRLFFVPDTEKVLVTVLLWLLLMIYLIWEQWRAPVPPNNPNAANG